MTRLLIIGYVWPEPESSAAGSRMMQLIKLFLDYGWKITFASPAADSDYMVDLAILGIDKVNIEVNCSQFDTFIQSCQPDVVIFDRFMMEEQFSWRVHKICPDVIKILETSDLHSLRAARQKAAKANRNIEPGDYHGDIAKREVASILRSDLTLLISSVELAHLQNVYHIDSSLLHYVPFMLDVSETQKCFAELPTYEERVGFMFIGNFFHEPNWDAVQYLKKSLWPRIAKKMPGVHLNIYGAYTSDKVRQLNNQEQRFHIMGRAESVVDVMSKSRICLAPLRFGAGIKGKLLDAMRCGTPSVTTTSGAEGMCAQLPWNGFIAESDDSFVQAACELYKNKKDWLKAQQNGIDIINHNFDKQLFGPALHDRIISLMKNLANHRQNNFMGAMLLHHSMRSTEYMSRWIEAKNKLK